MTSRLDTKRALREAGFEGFVPVGELHANVLGGVPAGEGVYVVVSDGSSPRFLQASPAGRFKGRDPTVQVAVLVEKWVHGAVLLYVGKAPGGATGNRGLAVRLGELFAFGYGRPIAHWGGRYLWQLSNSGDLEVAWRTTARPTEVENEMLTSFREAFGKYPFANIAGPRR